MTRAMPSIALAPSQGNAPCAVRPADDDVDPGGPLLADRDPIERLLADDDAVRP